MGEKRGEKMGQRGWLGYAGPWCGAGAVALVVAGGCAGSGKNAGYSGDGGAGDDGGGSSGASSGGGSFGDATADVPLSADSGCATGNFKAAFAKAAMLVVLDGSGTMAANSKYADAQQAIVTALDEDAFDSAYLGLLIYPTGNVKGPQCVLGLPVACQVPGLSQVPLELAGTTKSTDTTGVRHEIYDKLAASSPSTSGVGNANPSYDAIHNAITILQSWPQTGKRILFFITDGGASCASVSTRPGYTDGNGCPDWEYPASLVSLVQAANTDPSKPVNTIVVGVPGADTQGTSVNDPPYHVRLALSAEAWAGSPQTCAPTCNGQTFTQAGADPSIPCHFDMTVNYSPTVLANAINQIRGSLLGCVFDLPQPEGGTLDPSKVNVEYSTNGTQFTELYRRASPGDACTTGTGCWDYNSSGQVVLIGNACTAVEGATTADVQIIVGCQTVTQ
ncbi:MAG TPA: hypothetical protein VIF09_06190 [Polyangiaceae bacterium]